MICELSINYCRIMLKYWKGVRAEGLLVQGATVEMLLKEAQKLNTDLIITGHHDHNFLYKAFIGSTSEEIIKESKIPVLMVPLD